MKRLFILSILIMMMVYNECSKCTEYKEETKKEEETKPAEEETKPAEEETKSPEEETKPADDDQSGRRRRLVVEEKTCSALATSDDKKKKCVVNKDKTGCEEVDKDSSSMIKIPLFLLISLLFI